MFVHTSDFIHVWKQEMENTDKILEVLTDESLNLPDSEAVRTVAQLGWHIITTIPEMFEKMGVDIGGPTEKDPVPKTAAEFKHAYLKHANQVGAEICKWQDPDLQKEDDMYGQTWPRGLTLWIFLKHEIHHRGQLTVLMRMAGIKELPGIYGPSKEEWAKYGMPDPEF